VDFTSDLMKIRFLSEPNSKSEVSTSWDKLDMNVCLIPLFYYGRQKGEGTSLGSEVAVYCCIRRRQFDALLPVGIKVDFTRN
jgi:hypothetical protein